MNKILLVDADSKIPNLALMKLARFYKNADFLKLNIPYFPGRKKTIHYIPKGYDKVYCSVIFDGSKEYIKGDNIIFGGTGHSLTKNLPEEIDQLEPDYSLYPENDISYGFISRGCIRNCYFCKVRQKEGYIRQVNAVDDIVRHKKVKFMDNNFLALPNHKDILNELIQKKIKCQFNQGLDIRLIDKENSDLLSELNYLHEYIFAFDSWQYRDKIEQALSLLSWRKPWQLKFFVYIHPDMKLNDSINRIKWLKERECLPYIMRDISCWKAKYNRFYVDLAAWCNQPNLFKKMKFDEFLQKRHKKEDRITESLNLYKRR